MTAEKAIDLITRFGHLQKKNYDKMCCPRCGENTMRVPISTNALSRHSDCYICSDCGLDEAMRDYTGKVMPAAEWDIVKVFAALDESDGEDEHMSDL